MKKKNCFLWIIAFLILIQVSTFLALAEVETDRRRSWEIESPPEMERVTGIPVDRSQYSNGDIAFLVSALWPGTPGSTDIVIVAVHDINNSGLFADRDRMFNSVQDVARMMEQTRYLRHFEWITLIPSIPVLMPLTLPENAPGFLFASLEKDNSTLDDKKRYDSWSACAFARSAEDRMWIVLARVFDLLPNGASSSGYTPPKDQKSCDAALDTIKALMTVSRDEFILDRSLEAWLDPPVIAVIAGGPAQTGTLYIVGGKAGTEAPMSSVIAPLESISEGMSTEGLSVMQTMQSTMLDGDITAISIQVSATSKTSPGWIKTVVQTSQEGSGTAQVTLWVVVNHPPDPLLAIDHSPIAVSSPVVAQFEEPAVSKPHNLESEVHLARALAFQSEGNLESAEMEFQNAIDLNPTAPHLWAHLAGFEAAQLDWMAAMFAWKEAVRLKPGEARYHAELALALLRCGNKEEAVLEGRKAIELGLGPADHPVFAELGLQVSASCSEVFGCIGRAASRRSA